MKMTMIAISKLLNHVVNNISNYFMLIGLSCVMRYVFIMYGFETLLLSFGFLLILASFIIEINKVSTKR